jgi:pimeloyl-ACP methyl ester carboxylesterase
MSKVAAHLRAGDHTVFTPTLTGLGERSHLLTPELDMDTHIQDIVNVLEFEDLREVILVGKSFNGMVITAVAEKAPERLAHLVYLDALVPQDGQSAADLFGPETTARFQQMAEDHGDGWRLPGDRSVEPRVTDNPLKPLHYRVTVQNSVAKTLPRTYIRCTNFDYAVLDRCANQAQAEGWHYREIHTGHDPELESPQELADLLMEIA